MIEFDFKKNEPLYKHCTMKVGGVAKYYAEPTSIEQFIDVIKYCKGQNIKYFILGNGSNVIFKDSGFDGVVICTKKLNNIELKKNICIASCGVNMFVLNSILANNNLTGLEWSYGIPATLGGVVCMNAGAYGHEIGEYVTKIQVFDGQKIRYFTNSQAKFCYRNSIFKQEKFVVLKVWLKLSTGNKQNIEQLSKQYLAKRQLTQPLEYHNSGSIFKSYNGESSGKIIDNLGLKGVKINGAQISDLHANFIVNLGNAKCQDIIDLIELIKQKTSQKNINLEEEVIFVGE